MNRRSIPSHSGFALIDSDDSNQPARTASAEEQELLRADAAREQSLRRLRHKYFDANLFGEPAWEILLALFVIDNVERRLSIAELTAITHVPLTTSLRWLAYLEEQDLVSRSIAPNDQRMVLIELTNRGRRAMESYFVSARQAQGSAAAERAK